MKNILIFITLICIAATAAPKVKYEGQEKYTPTKVEWATLYMEINTKSEWSPETGYSIYWVPSYYNENTKETDPNGISCRIITTRDYDRYLLQSEIQVIKRDFETFKSLHEWNWLNLHIVIE